MSKRSNNCSVYTRENIINIELAAVYIRPMQ
jgi:hypothetical protein